MIYWAWVNNLIIGIYENQAFRFSFKEYGEKKINKIISTTDQDLPKKKCHGIIPQL